ncbi:MAG: hypothetical protein LAT84_06500 [Balneolia bacterium]|nr:hypothetical protein [Balneolia bacterium]
MSLSKKEKEILERRLKLQAELDQIEKKLDASVGQLRTDVEKKVSDTKNKLSPAYWIRKYPNYAIGAAVALGFIFAPRRKRAYNDDTVEMNSVQQQEPRVVKVRGLSTGDMISSELKRMLMQKATTFIVDKIEDAIDQNLNKKESRRPEHSDTSDKLQS